MYILYVITTIQPQRVLICMLYSPANIQWTGGNMFNWDSFSRRTNRSNR